jgi:serine phosphatase RsbU (regulator of sigma subunit)
MNKAAPDHPPSRNGATGQRRAVFEGVIAALIVYVVAGAAEAALIGILRPTEWELTWISDVVLSAAFGAAVYLWRHLRATRAELSEHERADLVLQTQLSLAASMQQRLLPPAPAAAGGFEWAAVQTPAGRIGGDFYDFVEQMPGVWMALVADISGKGVPAAMALGLLRSTFRTLARDIIGPAQLVKRLSSSLYDEWAGAPYLTCIVVRVDTGTRTLTFANAGHPAGIVLRDSASRLLEPGGAPAGLLPSLEYPEETVDLESGDRCVLVTDGVTESLEDRSEPPDATIAAIARGHFASTRAMCEAILATSMRGTGPAGIEGWSDDRTIVAFSVAERPVEEPHSTATVTIRKGMSAV